MYEYDHHTLTIVDKEIGIKEHIQCSLKLLPKDIFNNPSCYESNESLQLIYWESGSLKEAYFTDISSRHGQYCSFYPDGNICNEAFYNNGVLFGPSSIYSKTQTLLSKTWFIDGKKHGLLERFYANGTPYAQLRYFKGQRHGLQEYYHPNGTSKIRQWFKHHRQVGTGQVMHSNGCLKRETEFKDGLKMGRERIFSSCGALIEESVYEGQVRLQLSRWNKQNQILEKHLYHPIEKLYDEQVWSQEGELLKQSKYCRNKKIYTVELYDPQKKDTSLKHFQWDGEQLNEVMDAE